MSAARFTREATRRKSRSCTKTNTYPPEKTRKQERKWNLCRDRRAMLFTSTRLDARCTTSDGAGERRAMGKSRVRLRSIKPSRDSVGRGLWRPSTCQRTPSTSARLQGLATAIMSFALPIACPLPVHRLPFACPHPHTALRLPWCAPSCPPPQPDRPESRCLPPQLRTPVHVFHKTI